MSFDALIAAHTEALNSNTAALLAVTESLNLNNEGREAAMAAIGTATPEKATRTPRKAKDDTPAPTPAPTVTASKLPTAEDVRKALGDWMGETDEVVERDNRKGFVKSLIDHFGKRPAELEPEQMAQVLFFLARHKAGVAVNFSADYDFGGDPTQGGAEVTADDDIFG